MSLSSLEITRILEELPLEGSFIQQVVQPDFPTLYLQIHQPGDTFWLFIGLEPGKTRLHRTSRGPKKPAKAQRFESFLKSRIKGGKIFRVEHVHQDRIILIEILREQELTKLFIRLWSSQSNTIVTDSEQTILETQYRRPGRGEIAGQILVPFQKPQQSKKNPIREQFLKGKEISTSSLNQLVDDYYTKLELQERGTNLIREMRKALVYKENGLVNRLKGLEQKKFQHENKDQYESFGELLKVCSQKQEKLSEITLEDWWNPGQTIRIELDPRTTVLENSQRYFQLAKKAKSNYELVLQEEENLLLQQERHLELTLELESLEGLLSQPEELQKVIQRLQELKQELVIGSSNKSQPTEPDQPGLRFHSSGYIILVGRNAKENDSLLRRYTRGNDYWLHTRDYPGGYVFIKSQKGKTIPLEVLLDAGNLALHYSKAKANQEADLYYTQVKFLRKPKDGKLGLVLPTQEKNLHIKMDDARIQRLLGKKHSS